MSNKDQKLDDKEYIQIKKSDLDALITKIDELEQRILKWLKLQAEVNTATAAFTKSTNQTMARFDETCNNIIDTIAAHQYVISTQLGVDLNGAEGDHIDEDEVKYGGLDLSLPSIDVNKKLSN